jgi:hypothetical protein
MVAVAHSVAAHHPDTSTTTGQERRRRWVVDEQARQLRRAVLIRQVDVAARDHAS